MLELELTGRNLARSWQDILHAPLAFQRLLPFAPRGLSDRAANLGSLVQT
jgi:hypothetical protein